MPIKAVLFDLGNTLYRYDGETEAEVFHRVLLSLGITKTVDEVKNTRLKAMQEAKKRGLISLYGKIRNDEFWYRWFSLILEHMDIYDDKISKVVCSRWFDYLDCSLFPEVKSVLLRLKQMGLKVGLLTNASEEEISIILGKANLDLNIFDIIVGTDTVIKVKPDPNFFRFVLKKLKVKPEEAIYVGDELEADYKGAKNVGMHALLIDRTEKHKQGDLKTIRNLKEILSHID